MDEAADVEDDMRIAAHASALRHAGHGELAAMIERVARRAREQPEPEITEALGAAVGKHWIAFADVETATGELREAGLLWLGEDADVHLFARSPELGGACVVVRPLSPNGILWAARVLHDLQGTTWPAAPLDGVHHPLTVQ